MLISAVADDQLKDHGVVAVSFASPKETPVSLPPVKILKHSAAHGSASATPIPMLSNPKSTYDTCRRLPQSTYTYVMCCFVGCLIVTLVSVAVLWCAVLCVMLRCAVLWAVFVVLQADADLPPGADQRVHVYFTQGSCMTLTPVAAPEVVTVKQGAVQADRSSSSSSRQHTKVGACCVHEAAPVCGLCRELRHVRAHVHPVTCMSHI